MAKYTMGFLLVVALSITSSSLFVRADDEMTMTLDEVADIMEPFGQGCESKPEREHVVEMLENREDAQRETKCFRQCLLQQFELMPEGEMEFVESKTIEMMNMMFSDKEADSRRILGQCNKELAGSTDKCEAAHGISMCMLREMRQANYKIPELQH